LAQSRDHVSGQPKAKQQTRMVIPYRQDVPPPGGFPSIDDRLLKRGLPKRGPSSIVTVSLMGITVAVGFFFTVRANKKNRELKMEQRALRANIVPFLVAEEDQRYLYYFIDIQSKRTDG